MSDEDNANVSIKESHALELLQTAYDLFGESDECADTGSDAWAWYINAGDLLYARCPRPIDDDDGTQKQCIANGHCGCIFGPKLVVAK